MCIGKISGPEDLTAKLELEESARTFLEDIKINKAQF
jgi:hypothetical protein